jgi:hypothetical protein
MFEINLYKVLSYLLLPVAALFGILGVIYFFMAFVMPPIFFLVFVFANITIYYVYAFIFLQKVVIGKQTVAAKTKSILRFTGIASLIFFTMSIVSAATAFLQQSMDVQVIEALENLKKLNSQQLPYSTTQLMYFFKSVIIAFGIVSALFAIHILQSLNLSAKFKSSFA